MTYRQPDRCSICEPSHNFYTHVHVEGDAFFPEVNWLEFEEVSRADFKTAGPNPYDFSFLVYDHVGSQYASAPSLTELR